MRGVGPEVSAQRSGAANGAGGRQPPEPRAACQPSMLGWLMVAHAPPWEAAHERPPPKVALGDALIWRRRRLATATLTRMTGASTSTSGSAWLRTRASVVISAASVTRTSERPR